MNAQAKEYLANRIKTASPIQLVIIAYEAAIGFLEQAKRCYSEKQMHFAGALVIKSQMVIRELKRSLNSEAGEVADNLFATYRSLDKMLTSASRDKSPEQLDRVISMLAELKGAWEQVARTVPSDGDVGPARDSSYLNVYT